ALERWRRIPMRVSISIELSHGETRRDLTTHGVEGLEFYILVTPHGGLLTATAALSNRRRRGDSRAFDEEQHFFQVELAVRGGARGELAPRPSRRAQTDEDSRVAALIFRDVKEHVVGHTCSARAEFDSEGEPRRLVTEWIPLVEVLGISDRGD